MKITSEEFPSGVCVAVAMDARGMAALRVHEETRTIYVTVTLDDGRSVQFFVNQASGLLVVDVIDADEKGGNEIMRRLASSVEPSRPARTGRIIPPRVGR